MVAPSSRLAAVLRGLQNPQVGSGFTWSAKLQVGSGFTWSAKLQVGSDSEAGINPTLFAQLKLVYSSQSVKNGY